MASVSSTKYLTKRLNREIKDSTKQIYDKMMNN